MKGWKHWREVWSATRPSPLSVSHVHSADMDAFRARVSFLTCIQGMGSERKGQKHWREVWSATPPSPLSISHVHSADIDALSARVISHVYSGNGIRKEGAEALARSLERNSSVIFLNLSSTLCRYGCVERACHISRVFSQSDRKERGRSTGAKSGAQLLPHLSQSLMYTLQIWMPSACVLFLTCIQTMRSERKGRQHWREFWSATRLSPLSISHVHSADMNAFSARVISDV
jgi:hypothetical protein